MYISVQRTYHAYSAEITKPPDLEDQWHKEGTENQHIIASSKEKLVSTRMEIWNRKHAIGHNIYEVEDHQERQQPITHRESK